MSRIDAISMIYTRRLDKRIVSFEELQTPYRIEQLLSFQDIMQLYNIARSNKLSSKPKEKYRLIDAIMTNRGFKKLASGTNRVVYKFTENQSFVLKIAIDSVGLKDNPAEFKNQQLLKPFVTKVFQVTPCGTVGLFERVNPISSREEFASVAPDIFDIITTHFLGKYVLADFGSNYFMNWGVRVGQFPVILDFPYVYELDGSKLQCNAPDQTSPHGYCLGEIDYDDGFNYLICKKCGKQYLAKSLELESKNKNINIICTEEGDLEDMKIVIEKSNGVVVTNETNRQTSCYTKNMRERTKSNRNNSYREKDDQILLKVVVEPSSDSNQVPENPIHIPEDVVSEVSNTNYTTEDSNEHEDHIDVGYNNIEKCTTDITEEDGYNREEFNTQVSLDTVPKIDKVYQKPEISVIGSGFDEDSSKNSKLSNFHIGASAEDLINITIDGEDDDECVESDDSTYEY